MADGLSPIRSEVLSHWPHARTLRATRQTARPRDPRLRHRPEGTSRSRASRPAPAALNAISSWKDEAENPFAQWLSSAPYGGVWVPIAGLGGWLRPAILPVLFPAGQKDTLLVDTHWPLDVDASRPALWATRQPGGGWIEEAQLHPDYDRDGVPLTPLAVRFVPPGRRAWLEPVQAFVLFHNSAPRHLAGGRIEWEVPDADGRPETIARWVPDAADDDVGVLEVRRDKLLAFMGTFEFDLALFYTENISDDSLPGDWSDEDQEPLRAWETWATDVGNDVRVVLQCVTVLLRPPGSALEEEAAQRGETLEYVTGLDPATGKPTTVSHPPDGFLTPVFIRREVLDRYLADPRHYTVTQTRLQAGHMWSLPIAITERGNVHVWLGDLGRIPINSQRHFQQFAVADDDAVPEWRVRQDIMAEFVDPPVDEGVEQLRAAIETTNQASIAYCGVPLYDEPTRFNEERIRALHAPLNNSAPAFQHQVTTMAILIGDHLSSTFFDKVKAPAPGRGGLTRLAEWIERDTDRSHEDARALIGGLFAVQSIRSSTTAHRAGTGSAKAMERAGIEADDLPEGFELLARGAADSLQALADVIKGLPPLEV